MNNTRKILAILLAVVLVLALSVSVFADEPTKNDSITVNGTKVGDFKLKGGTETKVTISDCAVVAGWNRAYWKTTSSGYWANIDWHKFELKPPPKGLTMLIR